jgi:hypothetical protein
LVNPNWTICCGTLRISVSNTGEYRFRTSFVNCSPDTESNSMNGTYGIDGASISPFQGFISNRGNGPQGRALGYRMSPFQGE